MQTSIIPHLLKKDIRHVGYLLATWIVLLMLEAIVTCVGFSSGGTDSFIWQAVYVMSAALLPLLQGLLIIVLIPLLIQDEPLVGSTAFWFTRPISNETLLAEKSLFIAGLLILPSLLIETIIFAINGIPFHDTFMAGVQIVYTSLAVIVPIAALATLSRTFAKFALWLVVTYVAVMVVILLMQFFRMVSASVQDFIAESQNLSLTLSRALAMNVVEIAGGIAICVHQYLTRNTRRSVYILIAALVAAVVVQGLWKFDFLKHPEIRSVPSVFTDSSALPSLDVKAISVSDTLQLRSSATPQTSVSAEVTFSNVPNGFAVRVSGANATFTTPTGVSIKTFSQMSGFPYAVEKDWSGEALAGALGGIPVVNSGSWVDYAAIGDMDTAKYEKNKSVPLKLQLNLDVDLRWLKVSQSVPLKQGSRIDEPSRRVEIAAILKNSGGCRVVLRERKVNLFYKDFSQFNFLNQKEDVYLLVNKSRNQAILPKRSYDFDFASLILQMTFTPLVNRSFTLDFTGGKQNEEKSRTVTVDDDWLAGAELVRIDAVPAGKIHRNLTANNVVLLQGH